MERGGGPGWRRGDREVTEHVLHTCSGLGPGTQGNDCGLSAGRAGMGLWCKEQGEQEEATLRDRSRKRTRHLRVGVGGERWSCG